MDAKDKLNRMNWLNKRINELEWFIISARRVWHGKLTIEKQRYFFKRIPYGAMNETVFEMDTQLKEELLEVLENRLDTWREEFSELMGVDEE